MTFFCHNQLLPTIVYMQYVCTFSVSNYASPTQCYVDCIFRPVTLSVMRFRRPDALEMICDTVLNLY